MAKRAGTEYVTRRDFYTALLAVWLYIMLIISNSMGSGTHWRTYVYWVGSLLAMAVYGVMAVRSGGGRAGNNQGGEARDDATT